MVRIVQASISAPVLNVSIDNGATVATNVHSRPPPAMSR